MTGLSACLGFLRELEGHAVGRLRGCDPPDHVRSCSSCARRLEAAVRQIRLLSGLQPPLPAALTAPAFLEGIHDRVLTEREDRDRPVARLLETLRPATAPEGLDWPGESIEDRARQVLGQSQRPEAEDELWLRVRRDVRHQVALRRGVRRRLRFRVAIVAAGIFLGAWFATNWGTSRAPDIVFQKLEDTPAVEFSPVAVLRHAHGG